MKTKFAFMAIMAAMVVGMASCSKDEPAKTVIDDLISMYQQSDTEAVEIVKGMGYKYVSFNQEDNYYDCLVDTTSLLGSTICFYINPSTKIVYSVQYRGIFEGNQLKMIKDMCSRIGSGCKIGGETCQFTKAYVDSKNVISKYSDFSKKFKGASNFLQVMWGVGVEEYPEKGIVIGGEYESGETMIETVVGEIGL